jgi:hypothetical protein
LHCPDWALCPPSRSLKCHLNVESALALFITTSDLQNKTNKTRQTKHTHTHTTYKQQQQQKHQFLGRVVDGVGTNIQTTNKQDTRQTTTGVFFYGDGGGNGSGGGGGDGGIGGNGGGARGVGGGGVGDLTEFVRGLYCFLCFFCLAVDCVTGV